MTDLVIRVAAAATLIWLGMVLAGEDAPRSRAHHACIGLETLKLAALVAFGAALLAG